MDPAARVSEQGAHRVELVFRLYLAVAEAQRLDTGHPLDVFADRLYCRRAALVSSQMERLYAGAFADSQADLERYLFKTLVRELVVGELQLL